MKSSAFAFLAGKTGLWILLACFLLPHLLAAAEIKITRISAEYRDARQFYRISEFFTERENTGHQVILRTQPEERAGYYITVKLRRYPYRRDTVEEAIRLEIIMPGDVEPTTFTFPLGPASRRNPLILVGLTGDHWPDPSAHPLAWRISFFDADENLVARHQSFLWSK